MAARPRCARRKPGGKRVSFKLGDGARSVLDLSTRTQYRDDDDDQAHVVRKAHFAGTPRDPVPGS